MVGGALIEQMTHVRGFAKPYNGSMDAASILTDEEVRGALAALGGRAQTSAWPHFSMSAVEAIRSLSAPYAAA